MPAISPTTSDEDVKPIHGILPDSVEEFRFAVALYKLDLNFDYQWIPPIFVAGQRGSTVVDFLVKVPPYPTMVFIDGEYWHQGLQGAEDELIRTMVAQRLVGRVNQKFYAIPAGKLKDQQSADLQARMIFGGR